MIKFRAFAAVFATAFTLAVGVAKAELKKEWVDYTHGDAKLKAYMVYDDKFSGKRPAVFVIHAREGMSEKTKEMTEMWASFGYVAFAADIFGFGQDVLPKTVEEMSAQTTIYSKDRALMRARTKAGYDALIKQPRVDASKIASVGYCFGGAVGVEFGATGADLLANVSIHGSFRDHEAGWAKSAKGRFLILHGAEDQNYPLPVVNKVVDELRAAKREFLLEVYSSTGHGFSSPKGKDEERANARSIATSAATFKEVFGM